MKDELQQIKEDMLKEHRVMTLNQWIKVDDNPIQRDTIRHAKSAVKKHLKEASITHYEVSAAETADGQLFKLDGHTRAYLWKHKQLDRMLDKVSVTVYKVKTIEDAKNLYRQFDNQDAAENAQDRFSGALRPYGVTFKSKLLSSAGIISGLYRLSYPGRRNQDIYEIMGAWVDVLVEIDNMNINAKANSGLLSAMVINFAQDGDKAKTFWRRFFLDQGIRTEEGRDGVEALHRWLDHRNDGVSRATQDNIMGRALTCYEYFQKGIMFKPRKDPHAMDLTPYLKWSNDFMRSKGVDIGFNIDMFKTKIKEREYKNAWRLKQKLKENRGVIS